MAIAVHSDSPDFENPLCVVSQEWTYAWDNAFTNYANKNRFKVTLDDDRCFFLEQEAASSWADQLTIIAAAQQVETDALGLQWLSEPRYVDNPNPPNIDGTIRGPNGTPSGLSGAPSVAIALSIIESGVAWRYVNIQICPGEAVPKKIELVEVNDVELASPVSMTQTTKAILGPKNRFRVSMERDKDGRLCEQWEIYDKALFAQDKRKPWREANDGEVPFCWFKDGDAASTAVPPDSDCNFQFDTGCDSNNSDDPADFTNLVTRRVKYCSGEKVEQLFLVPDPSDPTGASLIEHPISGPLNFVDCATGEPVPLPVPPCEDFEYVGRLWRLKGDPQPSTLVEWWADPDGPIAGSGAPHGNVSDIFTNDGKTLTHVNGPADRSYVSPVFSVQGTNANDFISGMGLAGSADSNGTDQGKLSAYFILPANARLRDGGTRTGERGGLWLNKCCAGELTLLEERTIDTTAEERGVFNGTVVPAGIHYAEAAISDLSAWWNLTLEASFDDGATYEPLVGYGVKPSFECIPVIKCKDTGALLSLDMSEVIELGPFDTWCEPKGCPECCDGGAADPAATPQTLRVAIQ